ncbi:glycosyltransferase family 2 protein [Loigolactobacillus iwatensis]|uniref:glycosyltransferase family 2 protein n=1 Tax=Loigolactobacillus iwatensis TaxID=1267156 RepID=UPI000F7F1B21|nr:glycosyltransferase family 2 protein [Loigolactobacillus iwatensis]
MLISVIVPFFNARQYVQGFVRDMAAQTYQNYELILIDDGSTDGSQKHLLKLLQRKEIPTKMLQQSQNQGVSAARNLGLEHAQGDYVIFSDIDDHLRSNYLARLSETAMKTQQDLVGCCALKVNQKGQSEKIGQAAEYATQKALLTAFLDDQLPINLWTKLIKRKVAKQVRFLEDIKINEDKLYLYQICRLITKATFIDDILYEYHSNQGFNSRNPNENFNPIVFDIGRVSRLIYSDSPHYAQELANKHFYRSQMILLRSLIRAKDGPTNFSTQLHELHQELTQSTYRKLELARIERIEGWLFNHLWSLYQIIIRSGVRAYG